IDIAIVLAFTLGILLYYLMPWVARLCPSEVKLTDKGLMTKRGPMRAWSWKDIISFNFTRRHGCRVMLLETRKGKTIEIGMGDYVSQDEVKQFLTSLGIDRVGEVAIER